MTDKNKYLQLMGITTWRLRDKTGAKPHFFCYRLNDSEGKPNGFLLADATPDHEITLEAQEDLLRKIAETLSSDYAMNADFSVNATTFVIALGVDVQAMIKKNNHEARSDSFIFSHSLVDLIQKPGCKKELWTMIKRLTVNQ